MVPLAREITPVGDVANNLTRPEDRSTGLIVEDSDMADDFEEYLTFGDNFDRLAALPASHDGEDITIMSVGDIVQLNKGVKGTPLFGCFIGLTFQRQYMFYTSEGMLYHHELRAMQWQSRKYFTHEEVAPLRPYLLTTTGMIEAKQPTQVPRELGGPILLKMNAFRRETEAYYRQYASNLERAFDIVAHPTEVTFRPLEEVISAITGLPIPETLKYPPALEHAISFALFDRIGFVQDKRNYGQYEILTILAKTGMAGLLRVKKWLHAYYEEASLVASSMTVPPVIAEGANIVRKFQKKCYRLAMEHRTHRRLTDRMDIYTCNQGKRPAAEKLSSNITWSETDRDFIRVLFLHTSTEGLFTGYERDSLISHLIRSTKLYDSLADQGMHKGTPWSLLVEIGAVQPFSFPNAFDVHVRPNNASLNHTLNKIGQRVVAGEPLLQAGRLRDSLAEIRKDWGDMPVYCIDASSTVEIDDGISLESIPSEPGNHWLHIHVVHLSAFAPPSHPIGQCALHRLATVYNEAAGTMTMLPPWVGRDFSLGANKPCQTFSAKVNAKGEILEQKIQPGFVRNVIRLTPTAIAKAFNYEKKASDAKVLLELKVGADRAPPPKEPDVKASEADITSEQKATLTTLLDLMRKYKANRNGIKYWATNNKVDLQISNLKGWPFGVSAPETWKAEFCLEDPVISLTVLDKALGNFLDEEPPAQTMVEQAMIIGCVVAAKYAHDRNLPIFYVGTRKAVDDLATVTPRIREEIAAGEASRSLWRTVTNLYATTIVSSRPHWHGFLALPEYARVTSPLRRHEDLINMWQLDAALLEDHRRATATPAPQPSLLDTAATNANAPWLPYSRPAMDRAIRISVSRSTSLIWYNGASRAHWALLAIARALYFNEASLPHRVHIEVGRQRKLQYIQSLCLDFEMSCNAMFAEGLEERKGLLMSEGEVWEAEISDVFLNAKQMWVKPVRRVALTVSEWHRMRERGRLEERESSRMKVPVERTAGTGREEIVGGGS